jgi:TatD DNase family protein
VVHTARALAAARGLTFEDFAKATTDNFFRLYRKVPRPGADA